MAPTPSRQGRWQSAFSHLELLVLLAAIALVILLALPMSTGVGRRSKGIQCVGNLKQFGLAFRITFDGFTNPPPWQAIPGKSLSGGGYSLPVVRESEAAKLFENFMALSNHLVSPKILLCPADRRPRVAVGPWSELARAEVRNRGLSWFLGLEANELNPGTFLVGDGSLEAGPPLPRFSPNALTAVRGNLGSDLAVLRRSVAWHPKALHAGQGNVALGDGSVQQLTEERLQTALAASGSTNNLIVQPGLGPD